MARSRGARRAPAAPVRVRSARRSGAAAVWRTARSRATTRSAHPRRWCSLALRSRALRPRASEAKVVVVDDWAIDGAEDEGRGRSCSRRSACARKGERATPSARRSSCLFRTDETVWKSLRNLGERVQIVLPEELNTYDVLAERLDRVLAGRRSRPPSPGSPTARPRPTSRRRGGSDVKDPRDIIIRPVVSEKSYAALRRERLHVRRRARRQQDRDPQGGRAALRDARSRRCTRSTARASASATARTGAWATRATSKRAIVTLAAGEERIDIFGS